MKKETSCGSVIFTIIDGRYYTLLTQNLKGGHWSFPKGHVEAGETRLQTATREVLEETGLSISPEKGYIDSITYRVDRGVEKTVWYYVSLVEPDVEFTPQAEEVSAIKWVEYPAALSELTYKRDAQILQRAYEFLISQEDRFDAAHA